jgi:hypothetical protein
VIILHDGSGPDLSHIQAMADISEGFALFDYVRIAQADEKAWIGQIVQPNQNISIVGNRLDPTILHGLKLMHSHKDVRSVESVQIFDLLILGQDECGQMLTPRLRPLPGATVTKLDADATSCFIELPVKTKHADGIFNVIGQLLNADDVPLCVTPEKFNYHIMVAGGTGSGKSNVATNLVYQALKYGKCVLVHDAKPDYGLVHLANTDKRVTSTWQGFKKYGLVPQKAANVIRVGFKGMCDPANVDRVVGFRASDFNPDMLASLFFVGSTPAEQNAFEGFAGAAYALYRQVQDRTNARQSYSIGDILEEVRRRSDPNNPPMNPQEIIHQATGQSILRKVNYRLHAMPWLDTVGQTIMKKPASRLGSSVLDKDRVQRVEAFNMEQYADEGRLIVIDYALMDDQAYALLLSYFLRECQKYRKQRKPVGIVQLVDEAHRIFDNESRHSSTLTRAFERVMREGRAVDHSIILSLQNASQIPTRVMNNLNTKIVMRQNSKAEADAATQTMGKDFATQSMRLGTGHALVSMHESRATVLVQMAPSPFELMRNDNTGRVADAPQQQEGEVEDDYDF